MGLIPEHPSPTNHALIGVLDTFSFNTVPQRCGMRIYSKILAKDHLHHQIPDVHPLPVPSAVPAADSSCSPVVVSKPAASKCISGHNHALLPVHPDALKSELGETSAPALKGGGHKYPCKRRN
uniref:Uncharacterized protein n=1 Tax=Anas zonorhyncha TaxID=75864 RepID=A0A8B9ZXL1_9AVES